MKTGRMEAFSDGVIAILITIMVLEFHVPPTSELEELRELAPVLLSYILSFVYLGIYWNNHHHLLQATERINGAVLWANLHLLFWLSLVPFATAWMGERDFNRVPTAIYGVVLLASAIAYYVLQTVIVRENGRDSLLADALGRDLKGKVSPVIYAIALPLTIVSRWIAIGGYVIVALIWLVPDRRLESRLK